MNREASICLDGSDQARDFAQSPSDSGIELDVEDFHAALATAANPDVPPAAQFRKRPFGYRGKQLDRSNPRLLI